MYCRMVPHKTVRGQKAMERVKTFEGVPPPYDKTKRMVVPHCLRPICLQHGHRYCRLATLSSMVRVLQQVMFVSDAACFHCQTNAALLWPCANMAAGIVLAGPLLLEGSSQGHRAMLQLNVLACNTQYCL